MVGLSFVCGIMVEFSSDVEIKDIVIRDPQTSKSVEEPIRASILDMLAEKQMSIKEIKKELENRGHQKTVNTIRHHVNELRETGLVEVSELKEGRGGTKKYYQANTIVLSYTLPEEKKKNLEKIVKDIESNIEKLISVIEEKHGEEIDRMVKELSPCQHCEVQNYKEYILLTIIKRAFVRERQKK